MKLLLLLLTITSFPFSQIWCQEIKFEQVIPTDSPQLLTYFEFNSSIVSFADIDNDNDEDLVAVTSNETMIYLNDGNGNFSLKTQNKIVGYDFATSINFADVDGDGHLDFLITANYFVGVFLYINDGQGNFTLASTNFNRFQKASAEFSDVDNDGDLDVFITGENTSTPFDTKAELYFNNGIGEFSISANSFTGVKNPSIAFGDLDNDLDLDLIYVGQENVSWSDPIFKMYINNGRGLFTEKSSPHISKIGGGLVKISDMNNDSLLDIILARVNDNGAQISKIFYNNESANFSDNHTTRLDGLGGLNSGSIEVADIDNDGDNDLLLTGPGVLFEPTTFLYLNNGNESFSLDKSYFNGTKRESAILFADTDGDDDLDLLITGTENEDRTKSVSINSYYINNGEGDFSLVENCDLAALRNVVFNNVDLNNDGFIDLLISGANNHRRSFLTYLNNKNGNFLPTPHIVFQGVDFGNIEYADIENDGDLDILVVGQSDINPFDGFPANLYINQGNLSYDLAYNTPFTGTKLGSAKFADIDNDGDIDLFISGPDRYQNYHSDFYINDGKGNFNLRIIDSIPAVGRSVAEFHDFDNDGDLDLMLFGSNNSFTSRNIYLNDGVGNFNKLLGTSFRPSSRKNSVVTIDIENDGDMDIFIVPPIYSNKATIYYNEGNGNFTEVEKVLPGVYAREQTSCHFVDINNDDYLDLFIWDEQNGTTVFLYDEMANFTKLLNTPFFPLISGELKGLNIDNDDDNDIVMTGFNTFSGEYVSRVYRNITCDIARNIRIDSLRNDTLKIIDTKMGYSYQWLNCDSSFPELISDTLDYFVPKQAGNYSVVIKYGFCTDTTNCFSIEKNSIVPSLAKDELFILPNPTKNEIQVTNFTIENNEPLRIFSFDGMLKMRVPNYLEGQKINVSNLEQGVYIVKYQNKTQKFIVIQ